MRYLTKYSTFAGLTDESISTCLDGKVAQGVLREERSSVDEEGLRSSLFLAARKLVADGVFPPGVDSMIDASVMRAMEVIIQRTRPKVVVDKLPINKRRRSAKRSCETFRQGTFMYNDKAMDASRESYEAKLNRKNASSKVPNSAAKSCDMKAKNAEKEHRWELLTAEFPGTAIVEYKRRVGRYLTGRHESNDLIWAKSRIQKLLESKKRHE